MLSLINFPLLCYLSALLPVKAEMPQRQSRLSSGARRTFFCRIKNGNKISSHNVKSERDNDVGVFGKKKKHGKMMKNCFYSYPKLTFMIKIDLHFRSYIYFHN